MFPVPFKRRAARWGIIAALGFSSVCHAAWQLVLSEQGKRIDIDRESIVAETSGKYRAKSRVVLDKPIVDPRTTSSYQTIEITYSFNCAERTRATLRRSYYTIKDDLVGQEEVRNPVYMIVRAGTTDDRLLRAVCRIKDMPGNVVAFESINDELLESLRQYNEKLQEHQSKRGGKKESFSAQKRMKISTEKRGADQGKTVGGARRGAGRADTASARRSKSLPKTPAELANPVWSYHGEQAGPNQWGQLHSEFKLCSGGKRQAPIDIRETLLLDLPPFKTQYAPVPMRVIDGAHSLVLRVGGGSLDFQDRSYELMNIHFHRPAETVIQGKVYDLEAHLVHRDNEGKIAVVAVLFDKGQENPVVQFALNYLPLERGGAVTPQDRLVEVDRLLPTDRRYFVFMGSLSSPPCTEDVTWIVFKQPQQISPEQLAIFERLYPTNARPVQPAFGRLIKESR